MERWWWGLSATVLLVTAVWWGASRAAHVRRDVVGPGREHADRR